MKQELFSRKDFYQTYTFERSGDALLITVETRITITNITDEAQDYHVGYHFEKDNLPNWFKTWFDGDAAPIVDQYKPHETRRGIVVASGRAINLMPGASVVANVRRKYTCELTDGRDMVSFGKPTDGVTFELRACDGIEACVDSLRDFQQDGDVWTCPERFEIEQHVNIAWWLTDPD